MFDFNVCYSEMYINSIELQIACVFCNTLKGLMGK